MHFQSLLTCIFNFPVRPSHRKVLPRAAQSEMEKWLFFMVSLCLLVSCCSTLQLSSRLQGGGKLGIRLEPTYEFIPATEGSSWPGSVSGTYALWQAPPSAKAILLIAHGTFQGPEVWWDASPGCPFCIGWPEERSIVLSALERGYAVITIKSVYFIEATNGAARLQRSGCAVQLAELAKVQVDFVESWSRRRGVLEPLPVAALGVSAGGYLVSALASQMSLYAAVFQVSSGCTASFEVATPPFPPTLFISMPRDVESEEEIQKIVSILASKGFVSKRITCLPLLVTESYFVERLPGLGMEVSAALYNALVECEYLDGDGHLNQPENMDWGSYLGWDWSVFVESLHVLPDDSNWIDAVAEELAVSYAFHAVTSSRVAEMLDWLDEAHYHQVQ